MFNFLQPLGCEICDIKVTSSRILQRHLDGRKHKMREERQGKVFKCDLCDITANSEIQLDIHLKSSRHRSKVERKEYTEFINTPSNKGIWILVFCAFCIFINLILLFNNTVQN
ncbi:hypothetical protein JTB14_004919 [Gonioctena quinquepunctata]|nr:hypothetical protein JTB14_004919 [Gonioctena quinquepunctata]